MLVKMLCLYFTIAWAIPAQADCLLKSIELNAHNFDIVYNGQGSVKFKDRSIILKPKTSKKTTETHAALVLLKNNFAKTNYKLQVDYINLKPLREKSVNPWELLWVMFNYQGSVNNKKTNYFVAKTNGLELGRAYKQVGQDFLITKSDLQIKYQELIQVSLQVENNNLEIKINQNKVIKGVYSTYNHKGQVGFYTEDAAVRINQVKYCQW